jgi:very-short-patch-repair endonuclease
MLSSGWIPELPIKTGVPKELKTYPTCYKVDIGHPVKKIAIELDGNSHTGKRKALDMKKDALLTSLGWKVFRVKNYQVPSLSLICKSEDTLLTLLEAS